VRRQSAFLLSFLLVSSSAFAQPPYVDLEDRLTAAQLHATGLDRLAPEELALLNRLLREDRVTSDRAAAAASIGLRPTKSVSEQRGQSRVESAIRGEFRGWSAGTVLDLENGQQWRVTEGHLVARRARAPKVTITPGLVGGWYLQVEGEAPRAKVRRIR
jgi:hypothetical protein